MSSPNTPAVNEEQARLSTVQRMIGTLFSPGETFADINRKPNWIVAALISIVIAFVVNFVVIKRLNPDWKAIGRKQVEKSLKKQGKTMADLPEEQRNAIEKQLEMGTKVSVYITYLGPLALPILMAFLALLYWGGATIMGGQTTYKKVLSLTAYAFGMVVIVVQSLLAVLIVFLRNPDDVDLTKGIAVTNPGMLMSEESSTVLTAALTRLDVFSIWFLILMAMGLPAVCKNLKSGTATLVVFGLWLIYAIVAVALAAVFK
jgi:Yip1-like protein